MKRKITTSILPLSTLCLFILFYAILRFTISGDVSSADAFVYHANKMISVASLILLAAAYLLGRLARVIRVDSAVMRLQKHVQLPGYALASLHSVTSVLLFSPSFYPRLFHPDGALTYVGELSILFGVLAFGVFGAVALSSTPFISNSIDRVRVQRIQRSGYLGLLLVAIHIAILGLGGFLRASSYIFSIVLPLSLCVLCAAFACLFVRVIKNISNNSLS